MFAARSSTHHASARGPDPGARRPRRRRGLRSGLVGLLALGVLAFAAPAAMADAWSCDATGYTTQWDGANPAAGTQFNRAERQPDGSYLFNPVGTVAGEHFNAIGFRAQDGFVYGYNNTTGEVMRVERDPVTGDATFAPIGTGGIPAGTVAVIGTVLADGNYFLFNGVDTGWIIDVSGPTASPVSTVTVAPGGDVPDGDFAVNPVDNQLYAISGDPPPGTSTVYQWSLAGGVLTQGPAVGEGAWAGGQWFTPAGDQGTLIQYQNNHATVGVYSTDIATGVRTFLGPAPQFSNVDSASCPYTLAVTKDVTPRTVEAGEEVTYTHTVTSRGLADYPVDFVDQLPAGMTYVPGGVTVDPAFGPPNAYGDTDTLSISGTIARNETVTITARVLVSDDAGCGPVDNQAQATLNAPGLPAVTIESDDPTTPADPLDPTMIVVACAWSCDANGYLFQTPDNTNLDNNLIQQLDLVSGEDTVIANPPNPTNAVGYNVVDDFIYGTMSVENPDGTRSPALARIHADGSAEDLGLPPGIPDDGSGFHIGDVDANGHYWVAGPNPAVPGGMRWFEVDLATPTPTVVSQGTIAPPPNGGAGADWAWVNGAFYSVGTSATTNARLLSFAPGAATWTDHGAVAGVPSGGFGAVFADAAGFLYASDNATGFIYRINPVTGTSILVTDEGPQANGNDGARCADAPIPTVTVTKTVGGRALAADQFTVGLEDDGGDELASATTTGTDTSASTTNWPVSQDATYTITDAMAAGSPTPLEEYVKSIECTDADGNTVTTGGSEPNWTLTVAEATDYTCNVTNAAVSDVVLAKSAPATVAPGGRVTWTITATNNGPSTSSGATVTDSIPAGISNPATATPGCAVADGSVTCTLDTLAVGASTQVIVTGTAPATPSTCFTNEATVMAGDQDDPNAANNTATATTCTTPPPPPSGSNVSLEKTASDGRVTVGDTVTYTLVARNAGPGAALDRVVTDTVPRQLDVRDVETTQGTCAATGNDVRCAIGTLAANQAVTITVEAVAIRAGSTTNAANINGCAATPCAEVPVRIVKPKLRVSKKASKRTITAGDTVKYRIRVSNPSKAAVRNVRVCDRLPSGLVYVSSNPKAKVSNGRHCWTVRSLKAGKRKTFKVTVRALSGTSGRKVNRVTATSPNARGTARAERAVRVRAGGLLDAGGVTG